MDIKKLAFTEQLSSTRKKVVSGFGLGLLFSFIALSVLLFNYSCKAPFLNPVFQGFRSSSSHDSNSSKLSSPISFSSSSSNSSTNGIELPHSLIKNETLQQNTGPNSKDQNFTDFGDNGVTSNNTHLMGLAVKNVSLSGGGRGDGIVDVVNGSHYYKKASFNGAREKGVVLGGTDKGHFPDFLPNGSSNGVGGMVKNVAGGQSAYVPLSGKSGNETYNGGNVESRGVENKVSDVRSGGISSVKESNSFYGGCDIFHGRWVKDDTKPYYPPGSCPYIDRDFDCPLNGRLDDGYVRWKWQPYGCDMPSLNATDFLERLRGKKLVFVGDSLNRNMWESLVCILRHSIHDKKRVYEISGRREFKKKGFYAFRFEDYDCSVDFVGSPFLVKEIIHNGKNGSYETLRLDLMDQTTSMYHDADVIIFNTGHWWTHEKTSRGEDYYQEGNYVHPRLQVLEAYKRALGTWARWVDKNIDARRTQVIFRGYSVTHFRGGPWNSGGQCHNETEPIFNDAYLAKYPSKMRAFEHVLQDMKTPVIYLNISRLTDYRKDAHPSIYRKEYRPAEKIAGDHVEDCSHWCLPGVPDTWNELLYASLLQSKRGSWGN